MQPDAPTGIEDRDSEKASWIKISLCGDVMTGRGLDQILPCPGNPRLFEPRVRDARDYVAMAENAHGAIGKPVDYAYVWGYALEQWKRLAPDVRIINLETSVTTSDGLWPGKDVHYRMHPDNVAVLQAAKIDGCSLANNHVLDWGYAGLAETLASLRAGGIKVAGAGRNAAEAQAPAVLEAAGKGRVLVFSFGTCCSGIPPDWAARTDRAGVNLLEELSDAAVERISRSVARVKGSHDVVVASIHWGGNWGYEIPTSRIRFAQRLIDEAGVDLIHGHSCHHVQGIEVYQGHLILYGCGDFLDDYEGISGYDQYRDDLSAVYAVTAAPQTGRLVQLELAPTRIRHMRVEQPSAEDVVWLRDCLARESRQFGVDFNIVGELVGENVLVLNSSPGN